MIRQKDVIRLKIPFPNISSVLAYKPHMYVCYENNGVNKALIKCQTFKLSNIIGPNMIENYIQEPANPSRNPFVHETLVDCEKMFYVNSIIPLSLLTTIRRDICDDLFLEIVSKLAYGGYSSHQIDDTQLQSVNPAL